MHAYFFFLDEAISTLRMTKTRATERRNLLVTLIASSLRPGVYLFCSSFTSVPSKVSMNWCKSKKRIMELTHTHWLMMIGSYFKYKSKDAK